MPDGKPKDSADESAQTFGNDVIQRRGAAAEPHLAELDSQCGAGRDRYQDGRRNPSNVSRATRADGSQPQERERNEQQHVRAPVGAHAGTNDWRREASESFNRIGPGKLAEFERHQRAIHHER